MQHRLGLSIVQDGSIMFIPADGGDQMLCIHYMYNHHSMFVRSKQNCLGKSKLHVTFVANDLISSAHEILLLP